VDTACGCAEQAGFLREKFHHVELSHAGSKSGKRGSCPERRFPTAQKPVGRSHFGG
jgi:hypothetical protein